MSKKIVKSEGKGIKPGFVKFLSLPHLGEIPFKDAEGELTLTVTEDDMKKAKCSDPNNCVLAVSGKRSFGALFHAIVVGKTVLHIILKVGDVFQSIRFGLTGKLKKAVHAFDKSKDAEGRGKWILGVGDHTIGPLSQGTINRTNRRNKYGGKGGKSQGLSNIMSAPTRVILSHVTV